jgi:acetyl esterase/lipase
MQAVTALLGQSSLPAPADRDDWRTLRANGEAGLARMEAALPGCPAVSRADHHATSHDGTSVLLRWYAPPGHDPSAAGPAAVYLHGGGMIMGTVALYDRWVAAYAADSGVPLLAVDYRRAPEHPHPAPVEDAYAGLAWLAAPAAELGVDPARIAVMGDKRRRWPGRRHDTARPRPRAAGGQADPHLPDAGRPHHHPRPGAGPVGRLVIRR